MRIIIIIIIIIYILYKMFIFQFSDQILQETNSTDKEKKKNSYK